MQDLCDFHEFFREKDNILGQGAQGYIHQACSKEQIRRKISPCSHVVKEIGLLAPTVIDEMAGSLGIGPHVWVIRCPDKKVCYLVQDRLDKTLREYGKALKPDDLAALSDLIFSSIDRLQIFHNDLHDENIMRAKDGRFFLIDYTSAVPIAEIGWRAFDRLLKRHAYIDRGSGEPLRILTDRQLKDLAARHRPDREYSPEEIARQAIIRKARQDATRAAEKRIIQLVQKRLKKE